MREDAIARPGGTQMNAFTPSDPTLDANGMTIKSIDYYADPDRRAYGFRLKNGEDLRRQRGGSPDTSILRGLTFISDNPVYIQGDFNLHTSNGTNTLTEIVGGNLDPNFANPEVDYWRPAEIIGDSITVLSDNFCDGSIQDGYLNTGPMNTNIRIPTATRYGCIGNNQPTSYSNQNRPQTQLPANIGGTNYDWALANPWEAQPNGNSPNSPIVIDNDGEVMMTPTGMAATAPFNRNWTQYNQQYNQFSDRNFNTFASYLTVPADTTANLTMINGIVPAQFNQGNGGLINFPRLLENWLNNTLSIDGFVYPT